jgi:hypothetical protein
LSIVAEADVTTIAGRTLTGWGSNVYFSFRQLNNHGDIVFAAESTGGAGVFTPTSLVAGQGATIDGTTLSWFNNPSINNAGDIRFVGQAIQAVFSPAQKLAGPGTSLGGHTLSSARSLTRAADNGDVGFWAFYDSGKFGLFTLQRGLVAARDGSTTIAGKTITNFYSGMFDMSNSGTPVFGGVLSSGGGLFTPTQLLVETGQVIGGQTITGFSEPSLNSNGQLAFRGFFPGGQGIFSENALLVETGQTIAGKTITDLGTPQLNDQNDLFFRGDHATGRAIFKNGQIVAQTGDFADGKELVGLSNLAFSVNDAGQVLFDGNVRLGATEHSALILASPVPEPGTLAILACGGLAAAWLGRRRLQSRSTASRLLAMFVALATAALSSDLRADAIALDFASAGSTGAPGDNYTLGWKFSLSQAIVVHSIGLYDFQGNGFSQAHEVGIWDDGGSPVLSLTVPSGTAASLVGGNFRFVNIPSTTLVPGAYTIGALFLTNSDEYTYSPTGLVAAPEITLSPGGYWYPSATLVRPVINDVNVGYFGPNFGYTTVPEPGTCALLIGGGLAAAWLALRRRRRQRTVGARVAQRSLAC